MSTNLPEHTEQKALSKIVQVVANKSSMGIKYAATLLGIAVLLPGFELPGVLGAIAGTIGVEAMSSLIERVSSDSKISDDDIVQQVQDAIAQSGINQLPTKEDFDQALDRLLTNFGEGQKVLEGKVDDILKMLTCLGDTLSPVGRPAKGSEEKDVQAQPDIKKDRLQIIPEHLARKALDLASQERFDEALNALGQAYRYCDTEAERKALNAIADEIQKQQSQCIWMLATDLKNLMTREAETLAPEDLAEGEMILARLQNVHRKPSDLERWSWRWRAYRQQAETWWDYKETRQQLDALWQAPSVVLSEYDRALALARQKAGQYEADQRFQELLAEAERRREGAYKEEGELTTQATEGNFEPLFALLEQMRREGYNDLPWYDWGARETEGAPERALVSIKQAPADEAITHLRELAAQYQNAKAKDYLGRAQTELPAHPKAAADWIEKALAFEYIDSVQEKELRDFFQQAIQPALDRRQQATALVQDALQTLDIQEAWLLLGQAVALDPYAPEIEGVREQLRPRLRLYLRELLILVLDEQQAGLHEIACDTLNRVLSVLSLTGGDEKLKDIVTQATKLARQANAQRSQKAGNVA